MRDARKAFDDYTVESSHLDEIVEVLQYTYLFGSRCLGKVLKIKNGQSKHDGKGCQRFPAEHR